MIIAAAYILDLILGDPQWTWHPVRILGNLIEKLERSLNAGDVNKKLAGFILVILVVGTTIFSIWAILIIAESIHPIFYFIVSIIMIYFTLSVKSLGAAASKVYRSLEDGDILTARKNLSMIVGRDTLLLERREIIRATVETVAEGTMDGIIAPLFYAFLGGPILAWAYKAINTLDSMVGYRSERFINFGYASAKIDGWANFIPSRLTSLAIFISSSFYRKYWIDSGRQALRYFLKGPEYNSEATEAAIASSFGIQLGGLNYYNALPVQKRLIGEALYPLDIKHIKESIKIAYISSALFMGIGLSLTWIIEGR